MLDGRQRARQRVPHRNPLPHNQWPGVPELSIDLYPLRPLAAVRYERDPVRRRREPGREENRDVTMPRRQAFLVEIAWNRQRGGLDFGLALVNAAPPGIAA